MGGDGPVEEPELGESMTRSAIAEELWPRLNEEPHKKGDVVRFSRDSVNRQKALGAMCIRCISKFAQETKKANCSGKQTTFHGPLVVPALQ